MTLPSFIRQAIVKISNARNNVGARDLVSMAHGQEKTTPYKKRLCNGERSDHLSYPSEPCDVQIFSFPIQAGGIKLREDKGARSHSSPILDYKACSAQSHTDLILANIEASWLKQSSTRTQHMYLLKLKV
jgi:hypothetical protein